MLRFLGLAPVDERVVRQAGDFATFGTMKSLERDGRFTRAILRPRQMNDEESHKERRGVVGGYRAYLSEDDIRYVDAPAEEVGQPVESVRP